MIIVDQLFLQSIFFVDYFMTL